MRDHLPDRILTIKYISIKNNIKILRKKGVEMGEKVILILVDGMRPDSLGSIDFAKKFISKSSYSMKAKAVMPSVTLPCHMSLFHSVDPQRHGILTNFYTPQVRPIDGLCEQLKKANKKCAFFYDWEQLRDLTRPDSLAYSNYISGHSYTYSRTKAILTENAIEYARQNLADFIFLYLGHTDAVGHDCGWMSKEYMDAVAGSWECIENVVRNLSKDYTVIVTADHGGHDRSHGSEMDEDMLIPIICNGPKFKENQQLDNISIKDIAPTVTKLLGCEVAPEWEGVSIF